MEATTDTAASPTTQLDPAFAEQWLGGFLQAWNTRDGDVLAAISTEDAVWHDPVLPDPARGREGLREFVRVTARAFPDFHIDQRGPLHISPVEPVVLFRWRMTGTMRGPWSVSGL